MDMLKTIALCVPLVAACKGSDKELPKPFAGPLTAERLQGADKIVKVCDDTWDEALAKVEAQLGPHTRVERGTTDEHFVWAASDGTTCTMFRLDRGECPPSWNKPGPRVNAVVEPMTVQADASGFAECVAATRASARSQF